MLPDAPTASSLTARIELLKRANRTIDSVVDGSSMEPALERGARIRISAQRALPPNGTAVAIMTPGGVVTHRMLCRGLLPWNRDFVLTQGDAAMLCDPPVRVDFLVGPVTTCEGNGDIPDRSKSAAAMHWRARVWRLVVTTAFVIHPACATLLVRMSLRGRVKPVQWPT